MALLSWRSPRSVLALSRDPDGTPIARRLWPGGSTPWRVVALLGGAAGPEGVDAEGDALHQPVREEPAELARNRLPVGVGVVG